MTVKTYFQILKSTSIISESSTTNISLGRSGKNAVVKTLNGKPLLAIISRDNEHLAKKAEAALLRQLNDVGAKELKRSREVVQTAETFLLGVPFRRSGKGTVLIAIAGLHFPTGLDRISTSAFAFLKGRPETTADIGNLWASQEGNRRTRKTNRGLCHALQLPTAKRLQRRKSRGGDGQRNSEEEEEKKAASKQQQCWCQRQVTVTWRSLTQTHSPPRNLEKLSIPVGSLLVQERIKKTQEPSKQTTPPKQINKIAQVCYQSPHFAHSSQGCCCQSFTSGRQENTNCVFFTTISRRILPKTVETCKCSGIYLKFIHADSKLLCLHCRLHDYHSS